MKRAGFTMIELIFVIVILGILAAVAVPKLNATRDDAKATKAATEISQAVNDIGTYYVGHGSFSGDSKDMTNVKFSESNLSDSTDSYYQVPAGTDCIKFATDNAGELNVTNKSGATGLCKTVQGIIGNNDMNKTHSFGGSSIDFN